MNEDFTYFAIRGMTEHGEKQFDCTPDNTELYLHRTTYQDVDHIFHRIDDRDRRLGAFVWRHILGEGFDEHVKRMVESENWVVIYRPEPLESDLAQFEHDFMDIPDELPFDFEQ